MSDEPVIPQPSLKPSQKREQDRRRLLKTLDVQTPDVKGIERKKAMQALVTELRKHTRKWANAVTRRRRIVKRMRTSATMRFTLCQRCGKVMLWAPVIQHYCGERCRTEAFRLRKKFEVAKMLSKKHPEPSPVEIFCYFELIDMDRLRAAKVVW